MLVARCEQHVRCIPAPVLSPTQDPYANAYYKQWRKPTDLAKTERIIGRGGWVGTHNYELDSGAYFISLVGGAAWYVEDAVIVLLPC